MAGAEREAQLRGTIARDALEELRSRALRGVEDEQERLWRSHHPVTSRHALQVLFKTCEITYLSFKEGLKTYLNAHDQTKGCVIDGRPLIQLQKTTEENC